MDTSQHDRDQQRASAVADRTTRNPKGVTLGTQPGRENLGRINEWNHQPGGTEDNHVKEDHGGGSGSVLFSPVGIVDGPSVQTATKRKSIRATLEKI